MEIKEVIKRNGYNLTQIAQILGVSQQSISKSLLSPNIGLITLKNIAKAINLPLSELIRQIEDESTYNNDNNNNIVCPWCGKRLSINKSE